MAGLGDAVAGARRLWRVPGLMRRPLSLGQVRALPRRRFERREADFLGLARRAIWADRGNTYRRLLDLAGCEYGDLERLVDQDGPEGSLRLLVARRAADLA